jgi:hypothetical protein
MISYIIPVKTVSEANLRCHWAVKARRAKNQRAIGMMITRNALAIYDFKPSLGLRIKLIRLGTRKLDTGNVAVSMKAVQDGVCDALGIDDGNDAQAIWQYGQELQKKGGTIGVKVEIQ